MAQELALRPGQLSEELGRRGLTKQDVIDETGLSRETLVKIDRGEAVRPKTFYKLAICLESHPISAMVDSLLMGEGA